MKSVSASNIKKNMEEKIEKNNIKKSFLPLYIISGFITVFFILSLVLFLGKDFGQRKVFIFPSVETEIVELKSNSLDYKTTQNSTKNKNEKINKKTDEIIKNKYIIEYRNLKKNTDSSLDYYIRYYVDELLLGSGVERTKKLFAEGTKVLFCFVRNDVIYLNLSADLLQPGNDTVNIDEGVVLLEKNLKKNFPSIKKVMLFVNGKLSFEN